MSFYSRYGAAASSPGASSNQALAPTAQILATPFSMPNGSLMTLKTAEASYHAPIDPASIAETQIQATLPPTRGGDQYADSTPGILEQLGMWAWVIPAGVVAVGLGWYFIKRKSVGGYRRRRRSRR